MVYKRTHSVSLATRPILAFYFTTRGLIMPCLFIVIACLLCRLFGSQLFAVLLSNRVLRVMFGFIDHDWYCPALQAVLALSPRDSPTPGAIGRKPFDSSSPVKEPYMIEGQVRPFLLSQQLVLC